MTPTLRPWVRVLVILLVLLALLARESKNPYDGDAGVTPPVTDPDSAWHHRRVALNLSASRLAQEDRFLSFPDAAGCTDLPVFDELLALVARAVPGVAAAEEGRPPDQERLELGLRSAGPALAVIWLFFLYLLMRKGGGASVSASLAALALIAFSPIAVEHGAPGRLHVEALAGLLFAIQLGLLLAVWRRQDPFDRMIFSIVAGFVTGFGLATSPLFLAPLLASWASWVVVTAGAVGEERRNQARAALLFWACALVVGQVPAIGGPWIPATTGPVDGWTDLLQLVFFAGAVPLVLGLAGGRRPLPAAPVRLAVATALLGLLGFLVLPGPSGHHGTALLAALGRGVGSPPIGGSSILGPELVWVAVFLLALARGSLPGGSLSGRGPGPAAIFVSISGLLALIAALLHPPAVLFFAAPAGLALARFLEEFGRRRAVQVVTVGLLLWCGWAALAPIEDHEGRAYVRAAVWLRSRPAGGPWNSATAVQREGTLCDERAAPLLGWYGHRACATTGARRPFEENQLQILERVLAAPDAEEFARRARTLGLRYVVLGPGTAESFSRLGADPVLLERLRTERIELEGLRTIHATEEPRVAVLEIGPR